MIIKQISLDTSNTRLILTNSRSLRLLQNENRRSLRHLQNENSRSLRLLQNKNSMSTGLPYYLKISYYECLH